MTSVMPDEASADVPLRVLSEDGRADPDVDPRLPPEVLQRLHREMLLLRRLDERLTAMQRQGRIGSHTASSGQEAVPVAAAMVVRSSDWIFPGFREGGAMLVRGFPLRRYLAQVFGTRDDVLRGRQMPGHQSAREANHVSWSSCVGNQLSHAVGAAWAARRRGDDVATLAFFGDGATSSPDFHAALNFAAVLSVPCVFICQNNQYAASTPLTRQTAAASIAIKGRAYAVPGLRIDGNDVLAVYRGIEQALAAARSGAGPRLIEAVTYRLGSHSTADDPTRYRTEAEVDEWRKLDPLTRLEAHLRLLGLFDDVTSSRLEEEVRSVLDEAIELAEGQPPPDLGSLFEDVFARIPWHLAEQREQALANPARELPRRA
jgi:pyruvate dehydrogenase E1 component alpha subunit/2-oxoisovalerate dehydrogenase E1 component alpha subunit